VPKRAVRNLALTGITIVSATMLTALSTISASATTVAAGAPAASAIINGFEIENHDGLCLTAGADAPAVQANCTFAANQTWHQVSVSGRGVELRNGLNQCLGIAGSSKSRGARVYGWRCKGTRDQYWTWDVFVNYGLYIENLNSHLFLGVAGGSTKPGAAAVQWSGQNPPGGVNQAWNFE
jgi:hypothetical protein